MDILLWFLTPVILILAVGLGLSFFMTRRMPRSAFHNPAEYGLAFEEVRFPAADGLSLQGCWIPHPGSDRAVVILHGQGGCLDWDLHRAPFLHAAGYNVFLFDFRAHGRSQGRMATFGYLERKDVLGAVDFLKGRGMRSIGLLGFSYGGMASMLTAPLIPEVRAVVSDGGPARARSAFSGRAMEMGLPRWLAVSLAWLAVASISIRLGANLFRYEPIRWVGKIAPRPVLFIHGEQDVYLPDFDALFAATGEPKEAWRVPGVGHTKVSEALPDEFRRRILAFFARSL